jgi:hypothetical protein
MKPDEDQHTRKTPKIKLFKLKVRSDWGEES